ncbi:WcbI family polysaccharide biosynthesis putative acetyltransferase [Corynebacterium sp. YIM 101645]|uniref:WcbI family polysaccharide biosynthesis putative acetyltransferase n=1 Tax=Corynebacterium lemuris TaxID=1859292 RepID=A0ABT2FYP3_9CORY|nr:WcbI family polysaccharide biosynthesis putative acetyltransferase [Corynebacterium lemuris]MCS5480351.1 WcbI family polysaccharide biosynthesis putative acetyltransferase [Corynebacterium lemuris]
MTSPTDLARRRHYGSFYRISPVPGASGRPFVTVLGNCQAESLRLLLDSSGLVDSFRIPPVHEFTAEDVDLLREVLARTDVLVTQPVRPDYRDLPVGTAQLMELLPAGARTVTYPVLRWDGLMPYLAIVRDPADPSRNPPVVPYHDLRILVAASRGLDRPLDPCASAAALRAAAELSVGQLRSRETHHGTVVISDVLETSPQWHTINHPDNATLAVLAQRVLDEIIPGGTVTAPADREMLGGLSAPLDPGAAGALGVDVTGRELWRAGGTPLDPGELVARQLEFYRLHPGLVAAGLRRHAERLELLGLGR